MIRRRLYNNLLNALIPLSALRQSQALGWDAEWLSDVEADHDGWEPDELWAAKNRPAGVAGAVGPYPETSLYELKNRPASAAYPPRAEHTRTTGGQHRADDSPHLSLVPAADRVDPPVSATTVGGPLKSDEQIIEELVADYREFLRDCFARRFPPHNR